MKFCSDCGAALQPPGPIANGAKRFFCHGCGATHYHNPRVIVACIVYCDDRVLMCRRAEEPARGEWFVPTGFLECGETAQEAAARETREETGLRVDPPALELYSVINMTAIEQVCLVFRIGLDTRPPIAPGPECLEVAFMSEEEMQKHQIAWSFATGDSTVRFFQQLRSGNFCIHLASTGSESRPDFSAREYRLLPESASGMTTSSSWQHR